MVLICLVLITINFNRRRGSCCYLTTFPSGIFSGLSSIATISLLNNQISTLPSDVFSELYSLSYLHLEENNVTTLPSGLFDRSSLIDFNQNCPLASHHTGVESPPFVRDASISLFLAQSPQTRLRAPFRVCGIEFRNQKGTRFPQSAFSTTLLPKKQLKPTPPHTTPGETHANLCRLKANLRLIRKSAGS